MCRPDASLAGLALSIPATLLIPKVFLSTAAISIKAPSSTATAESVTRAAQRVLRRDNLTALMDRRQLYAAERGSAPLEDLQEKLRSNITIGGLSTFSAGTQSAFRVGFNYPDPEKAQLVTQDLTAMLIDEYSRQNRGTAPLEVLDIASLPQHSHGPNRVAIVLAGFLAGGLLGALLSLSSRAARQWHTGLDAWSMSLACGFAGLLLAVPVSLLIPDRFYSQAVFTAPASSRATAESVSKAVAASLRKENLLSLIERGGLAAGSNARPTKEELLQELEKNISVSGREGLSFRVGFKSVDRRQAQIVTQEVMTIIAAEYLRQNPGMPGLEILDLPSNAESPIFPNRPVIAFIGLLAGAGIGLLIGLVKLLIQPSTAGSGLGQNPSRSPI